MGEDGFLDFVDVVRAEADADVEGLLEMELDAGADLVERGVGRRGEIQGEGVAAFFETKALGSGAIQLDALGDSAGIAAILERGFAGAMRGGVGVGRVSVEGLTNDEDGLAMRAVLAGGVGKVDIGGEGDVAGGFLPEEVESVGCAPEISAGGG